MADFATLISTYKSLIRGDHNTDELYKWECVARFQNAWDLESSDMHSMIKEALKGKSNLLYHVSHWFLLTASEILPEELRSALKNLSNEEIDLQKRITDYQAFAEESIAIIAESLNKKGLSHAQDERTISFLLSCIYPEKYSFYKNSIYSDLCSYLDLNKVKSGMRLLHWNELMEDYTGLIEQDKELQSLVNDFLPNDLPWENQTALLFQDICFRSLTQLAEVKDAIPSDKATTPERKGMKSDNQAINQILFGPPGTGKTFRTSEMAVRIINPDFFTQERDREEVKKEFNRLREKERIEFVTFHQSFSYEDFVEGIKPVIRSVESDSSSKQIEYEIKDGVFKQIALKAQDKEQFEETAESEIILGQEKFEQNVNKVSLGNSLDPADAPIYNYCINNNCIALGFGEDIDFSGVASKAEIRKRFLENNIQITSDNDFNVAAIERLVLWMKPGQLVFVSSGLRKLKAIGEVSGEYYCDTTTPIRYSQFRKVNWLYTDLDIPVQEVMDRQFSQQSIYQIYPHQIKQEFFQPRKRLSSDSSKFVLIIDEINRGNISQIFGELITCLEDDKRIGRPEELRATLPYSRESFGVPSNLHIIGTMNTADRSVEALDSALRRRFEFVKVAPDSTALSSREIEGISLRELLDVINARLTFLRDKDHTIGHAYFIKAETLNDLEVVFRNKVVPLLEEYFYNSPEEIIHILGKGFEDTVSNPWKSGDGPDGLEDAIVRVVVPRGAKFIEALHLLMGNSSGTADA